LKQGNPGVSSQIFSTYHLALVGPPLIATSIFCFGFVLAHNHAVAQFGSTASSKPATSAIQPPSGLPLIAQPELSILPAITSTSGNQDARSSDTNDPEDQVTPQLPSVASNQIQNADQKRESAPNNDNLPSQALLQQLNSTIKNTTH